ncbi:NEW3 domain-containing protein [Actinoallomurus oryzae]|uniref:NEW3 domain-containing protein n=1 Tax=Actinoallomurus oryzae TaxID=502180 RepID=UPI0031F0EEC0
MPLAGPASAETPPPGPKPPIQSVRSPYGNPYTDFLRTPFGVTGSPRQQANLPRVDDDPNEPFDWYRYPLTAIGVLGGPEESIVTPQGNLQTVFGALAFATGEKRTPINQRVKTWKDGYLPILEEKFSGGSVRNNIEMFAAKVPGVTKVAYQETYGKPQRTLKSQVDNMVNFVKVDLTNTGDAATTYRFSVSLTGDKINARDGNNGPARPATAAWDSDENAYTGDGKLLFTAADSPTRVNSGSLDYDVALSAGQTRSLVFKMPYFVAQESDASAIRGADYDTYLTDTANFWHRTLDKADTRIDVPGTGVESKVLDTYKANLAFSLLLFDNVDGHYFWDANPTVYDGYWLRDTAFDMDGMLDAGFPEIVRGVTLAMLDYQTDDGQFNSQAGQVDATGQALWAFGNYYTRTHDKEFAQRVWPAVQRAMAWEWQARDGGLMPEGAMDYDNEGVRGHLLTYDMWNIAGEQGAVQIARAVGSDTTADEWQHRRTQYVDLLREKVKPAVDQLGFLPTTLEGVKAAAVRVGWYGDVYGIDWGNLEAAWPTGAFSPDDPWVTKSLKVWDAQTFEGIFGYPEGGMENLLHSYTTSSIGITHVRRGDQSEALQYLYGMLIHTSGTHMAAEAMRAYERWGRHGSQTDTMPHGEFSGKYLTTLHDMLAFEGQDSTLHLANVWAPQWAKPGRRVQFAGDTDFGHLAYTIDVADGGAVMHLDPPTRDAPKSTVVSIPQNDAVTAVTVNGHSVHTFSGDRITLPKLTGPATIKIGWKRQDPAPAYSFARAVSDYLASYHKMTSPPKVRVEDTATAHPTVRAGDLFQVTANVVNTGGAGYLDDPRVRLYVDGKPAQTDDRALAKGIGFTTPESVISFRRHSEGVVPVGLATTVCRPGEHTLGVALGDSQPTRTVTINVLPLVPTQPAPPADLALDAGTAFVGSHTAATATATVTNRGCAALTGVDVTLKAPDGWTAEPTSSTIDRVGPGESATVEWRVTPPGNLKADAGEAAPRLTATAAYGWETEKWKGRTKGSAEGETTMVVCTGTPPAADPKARAQWDFALGCAADLSGHGRVGGVGSGVTFTGTGASFNGTDDGAITIPYGADYQPEAIRAGQTWTLDLVGVVPQKVGGGYQAIANARSASGDYSAGWTVYVNPDGTFTFRMSPVNHPGNTYAIASSGVHAVAGKRYDIRARWDGSHLSIAVSGADSGSGSATTDGGYLPVVNGSMTLGKGTTGLADAYFFTGSIAATKITVE